MLKLARIIVGWRIALLLVVGLLAVNFSYRPDFLYTSPTHFASYPQWASQWLAPWANFDGVHYLQIAGDGYVDQGRFLPLFSGILAAVGWVVGDPYTLSTAQISLSFLVSQAIFAAMLVVWYKVWRLDFSDETAWWAIIFTLAFPSSFFLVSMYSESLFLLLAGLAFWFIRQKRFYLALVPASLLSITRLTGFVIIPSLMLLLWELQLTEKVKLAWKYLAPKIAGFLKSHWLKLVLLAATILPLVGYSYYNWLKWGDGLYFVHAHGALGNSRAVSSIVLPPITLYRYAKILLTLSPQLHEFKVAVLELGFFFFSCGLLAAAILKKIRWSYVIFSVLAILIPVLSGTLTGFPRYSLALVPIFPVLAGLPKPWRWALMTTGLILQTVMLVGFSRGYFIA